MNVVYTVRNGEFEFSIHVDPMVDEIDDTVVFEPVSTGRAESYPYEIWAAHATIHADIDASESEGATVQFAYSSDGITWEKVENAQKYAVYVDDKEVGKVFNTSYIIGELSVGEHTVYIKAIYEDSKNNLSSIIETNCIESLGECIVYLSSINLIDRLIRDKQR